MESELGSGGAERVAQTLDALKRTGSNILVVGSGTTDAHDVACRRLCGGDGPGSRYRLFVTDDAPAVEHGHGPTETRRTIEYDSTALDRDAAQGPPSIQALGIDVIEAIDEFDADADGFEPSELRVCVDSLATLFREHETEQVFRLVHMISSRVEQARAMGHFHLPVGRDHDAVRLLEPMFDATVELRARREAYEQRWHLRDRDVRTDWIRL